MDSEILFEEVQTFTKKSTQDFFKIAAGVLIASSAASFFIGPADTEQLTAGLLAGTLIAGIVSYFLGKARLITYICTDGIYVRFPPFQGSFSRFSWEDIKYAYLRTYDPLNEYGGWGIRFGPMGTVYTVVGNVGLQLILPDNKRLLIGTHQPEELAYVLKRIGKLNPPID